MREVIKRSGEVDKDKLTAYQKHRRPILPTLILSVVCAVVVILARTGTMGSVIEVGGTFFAFTDAFVMISAGIGGLGCGLMTFVMLFISEFLRTSGDISLYSLSIYLILVLLVSILSYRGWFKSIGKALLSGLLITMVLAFLWLIAFTVLPVRMIENVYRGMSCPRLMLMAFPETFAAAAVILFMERYAPGRLRNEFITGAECLDSRLNVLPRRVTLLSLTEAVVLSAVAILCSNLFSADNDGVKFCFGYILKHWATNLELLMTMMCAAVPAAYLLNLFILNNIVNPINAMSRLMDEYFRTEETERVRRLPDINVHSGDEVEHLYHSLQKMVSDMSDHIDRILEGERRTAHLTKDFMLALAKAVDAKDHYTSGHSQRVAEYSREIARRMGKSEARQDEIYTMGLLHDIGKIGVPESIINKNGRLTDEEYEKIKEHPLMGHEILKNVKEIPNLAVGARWHHERYDGRGYPDGLAGKDIPEEARIIGVADAYDAMTSNRAYSGIRPQDKVRAEIERCSGSQFDPEIADIMLQMIDNDTMYKMHE